VSTEGELLLARNRLFKLVDSDERNGQDWKDHRSECRRIKAFGDQVESQALANPTVQLDIEDRVAKFLDHHWTALSAAISTLFGITSTFLPPPDSLRTHLLVLEFDRNSNSRDNFDLLVLDECYLQSRIDFLLTPVGKENRRDVNEAFDHQPKNLVIRPALVAVLVKSPQKGGQPVLLPVAGTTFLRWNPLVRNYVSLMVSKSLRWAFKGPVCLNDFEASYRSSLREARWGFQPHGESFDLPPGQ
jgi:hypothetical protein